MAQNEWEEMVKMEEECCSTMTWMERTTAAAVVADGVDGEAIGVWVVPLFGDWTFIVNCCRAIDTWIGRIRLAGCPVCTKRQEECGLGSR